MQANGGLFAELIHLRLNLVVDHFKRGFRCLAVRDYCFLSFLQLIPEQGADRKWRSRIPNREKKAEKTGPTRKKILERERTILHWKQNSLLAPGPPSLSYHE